MKKVLSFMCTIAMVTAFASTTFAEESKVYEYGANKNKIETQGEQGWHAMYSTSTNMGNAFDVSTLKEAVDNGAGQWKPADADRPNADAGKYFSIRPDGLLAPDGGFTAAMKWVCPEDGVYKLSTQFSGGMRGDADTTIADGVVFSVYLNDTSLLSEDSGQGRFENGEKSLEKELQLYKGDAVYLISDPKENGGWDDPWWYSGLTYTGTLPVTETSNAEENKTETNTATTEATKTEATKTDANPKTGDFGTAAYAIMAGLSMAAAMKFRKSK